MRDCIDKLMSALVARASNEDGQTMIEYALLTVFIAIAALVGVQLLGANLLGFFNSFAGTL